MDPETAAMLDTNSAGFRVQGLGFAQTVQDKGAMVRVRAAKPSQIKLKKPATAPAVAAAGSGTSVKRRVLLIDGRGPPTRWLGELHWLRG
jgi:hypothetical protein